MVANALKSNIWFSADLHVDFHFLKAIYCIHYPGFLHVYQAAGQVTRLVQDATKCYQLAKSFLKLCYEQVYRDIMLNWWLHDANVETLKTLETVHDVVSSFSTYVEGFWTSRDPIRRYLACFFQLCELYFIAVKAVECNDSFTLELIMSEFQPIFFFCR